MPRFITDMGESTVVTETLYDADNNVVGESVFTLGRYGVWENKGQGKATVIDVGVDLAALQIKHGPDLRVIDF